MAWHRDFSRHIATRVPYYLFFPFFFFLRWKRRFFFSFLPMEACFGSVAALNVLCPAVATRVGAVGSRFIMGSRPPRKSGLNRSTRSNHAPRINTSVGTFFRSRSSFLASDERQSALTKAHQPRSFASTAPSAAGWGPTHLQTCAEARSTAGNARRGRLAVSFWGVQNGLFSPLPSLSFSLPFFFFCFFFLQDVNAVLPVVLLPVELP